MIKAIACSLLFLSYPLLAFTGTALGVGWLIPLCLGGFMLAKSLPRRHQPLNIRLMTLSLILLLATIALPTITAKLIPFTVYTGMAVLFWYSLRDGSSLIEQIVRLQFADIPYAVTIYCRQVTWLWIVFFAMNMLVCALLAYFATDGIWALYNSIGVFLLMAMLFVGEYLWRHKRFPDFEIPSPLDSIESTIKNGRQVWQQYFRL